MTIEQQELLYPTAERLGGAVPKSLNDKQAAMEEAAKYTALHKTAFRTAFDMLNKLFPPNDTVDYWVDAGKAVALTYNEHKDNELAKILLTAVYEYLEQTVKRRQADSGGADERCEPISPGLAGK